MPTIRQNLSQMMWVDEWWTVVLTVPIVVAFVPGYAHQVSSGMIALDNAPSWYVDAVAAAILFAFGRRTLRGVLHPRHKPAPLQPYPAPPRPGPSRN